jgi:hypothetical protein
MTMLILNIAFSTMVFAAIVGSLAWSVVSGGSGQTGSAVRTVSVRSQAGPASAGLGQTAVGRA